MHTAEDSDVVTFEFPNAYPAAPPRKWSGGCKKEADATVQTERIPQRSSGNRGQERMSLLLELPSARDLRPQHGLSSFNTVSLPSAHRNNG